MKEFSLKCGLVTGCLIILSKFWVHEPIQIPPTSPIIHETPIQIYEFSHHNDILHRYDRITGKVERLKYDEKYKMFF